MTLEIMNFVETQILPRYNEFGASHGIRHAQAVIEQSVALARQLGADEDMAYVIAAYHDLGMEGPRAIHHITSGKILASDARLKKWFSAEQLRIMREAVEDHRASSSHSPRNLYGRIVAEADRELDPMTVITRTIQYSLEHYPDKTEEGHWERVYSHLIEKYSENGYIHLWIPNSPNEAKLRKLREIIADKMQLRTIFNTLFPQLKSGQE